MLFRAFLCLCIFSVLSQTRALAQLSHTIREKEIIVQADSVQLDSQVIAKGTLILSSGNEIFIEGEDYQINYSKGVLILPQSLQNKLLTVRYRVSNFELNKPFKRKDAALLNPDFQITKNPFLYSPNEQLQTFFSKDGLKMNGSLMRGLSVGNNQNVVLNSNLNLQFAGRLQNDIDVLAAISDENNPIQPEGNTQQLQDFDKVFVRVSKNRSTLTVGDFEMTRPDSSYFMNYYKKSRGGQFYSGVQTGEKSQLLFSGEAAISRGRFARNIIQGIEGNQGPYRLSGSNNELFIIIISGTEAVFLDGKKLTRGEQNDYVIDYNSGEITFMPKRVITQYSRIVVEFQYSDRNYARSVFHIGSAFAHEKFQLRANYFSEQDDKDQPFLQNLTDSNKLILSNAGDDLNRALAPSEVSTNVFSTNKILYRKVDTLGYNGVFVHAESPATDTAFYEVRFSYVGEGKGDYIQAQSSANGRVFQWIAPAGGQRQGNYAPVIQLVSPKRLQMLTLGTDWYVLKNTKVSVEAARSDYDKNRYASFDKKDDAGYGIKTSIANSLKLQQRETNFWELKTEASHEFVDRQFRYVERYRNVEFDRTWNRLLTNVQTADTGYEEHIVSFRTALQKTSIGNVYVQAGYYNRESVFAGLQGLAGTALHVKKNHLQAEAEWIETNNTSIALYAKNETGRYKLDYGREFWLFLAGARYETEQSNFKTTTDSLLAGSFAYNQYSVYVSGNDTGALNYKIEYTQREDFLPRNNEFVATTTGKNVNGNVTSLQKNNNRLSADFTYREFLIRDTGLVALQPENTILARAEYDYSFVKRIFTANTYYQVGKGNELRRDFQYLEVPSGQGVYVWHDFNDDGVKNLNEFVLASGIERNQANYIKIFLPTNSSIRVQTNQFNQTLNINPAAVWSSKRGFKKFIARWYNQTAIKLDRKNTELSNWDFLNPFLQNISDTVLVSNSSLIRNTLFFNRSEPTFGFDVNVSDNRNKIFQTNGFDKRIRQEQGLNMRWNFSSSWGITLGCLSGNRSFSSQFFSENNYNYHFNEAKPKVIYQITNNIRATLIYSYFEGNNLILAKENGTNHETGIELRFNAAKQGVLTAKFSYYKVAYNGNISSPLGYDMMQGFTVGENKVWNINFQQRLGGNIQININYDGRQSAGQSVIHIGRMEARYLF